MAKPLNQVQPLPGFENLQFLLEIIRDKDTLQETLDTIAAARDEANARIALVGPASEIEAMHARQLAAEQEAVRRLEDARAEALRIVAEAQGQADGIVAAATELEAGVKQARAEAETARQDAETAQARANAETASVAQREANVKKRMEEAEALIDQAGAAKAEYENLKAKLQATLKSLG